MLSIFLFPLIFSFVFADCPPGTISESGLNKCYKYYKTAEPFLAAERQCNAIGGNLASIGNAFENNFIAGIAGTDTSSSSPSFWIGTSLLLAPTWSWTDNSTFSYKNWASGEPAASKDCASFREGDEKWITTACSTALPFMCSLSQNAQPVSCTTQMPTVRTTTVTKQPPKECTIGSATLCPTGYIVFATNCRCYKVIDSMEVSWTDAQQQCSKQNSTLAKIDSSSLNRFLFNLSGLRCVDGSCPWIGLHCTSGTISSCRWADGSPLGSYTNFYTKQAYPSNGDFVYKLIANNMDSNPGGWKNDYMSSKQAFICEQAGVMLD